MDASAADWADVLGFEAGQAAKDAAFEAEQDKRIAEEDKTFGLVLVGLGAAVFAGRWAIRPATTAVPPGAAPAAPLSVADELTKLAALHERGALTDTEFERQKRRLLEN
ncbi:SHOCT domain-containing protein [Streptomyces sp. SHP 1-2]|nr:SHOCT domain-containing protein [Streptomyces sp. SHP 1-2]